MEGFAPRVEFCALGPLGVVIDGRPAPLGSPKLRTVLAALLVDANSVVSSDRLIDILWRDDPPATAKATLQKLVYRLRLLVEPNQGPDRLLVTRAPGYVLLVGPEEYDAARFEHRLQTARAEADRDRVAEAVTTLDEALGLWRGPAFAEFAYDDFARAEATRLEELRVAAVEDRVDAKLALGRHEELIGELERTVDAHPLRERSRAQLMLALYRAGRQVEALRAYQDHRRYLVEELGLEPSTTLRSLEAAIVVQAAELDYERSPLTNGTLPSGATTASFPPPSVPAALGEAEDARAFDDRITRATATRIDLDLLEDELADNVMELHRRSEPQGAHTTGASAFARCPYKGLAPFEPADAEYFFGRERLVAELVARVAVERFVGVVGVSGSGKSSLLLAGLCPALRAGALPGSEDWLTALLTPGEDPLERLARALASGAPALSLDVVRARLRDDPDALEHIARDALAAKPPGSRLVVVVDQFEELFTMCRDDDLQRRFVDALVRSVSDPRAPVSVVVAVRADYYARCAALTDLAPLLGSTLLVGTMTDRELSRAIEEPARRAGLQLEPGLTDVILADVGKEPGALPLLSTALLETWIRRNESTLTLSGYENAGGVTGALTHLAESVYQQFSVDQQESCRRILLRLADPGEGNDDVRRRVSVDELVAPDDPSATKVLATLTDRRLVIAGADGVEVAHEALLREWPRARAWLEDDRDGRRLHHHLAASATGWEAAGRDPAELYRGARLASALDWSTAHPGVTNQLERAFLETASAEHDAELRTARRSTRRLRALLSAVAVLLVVAIVAGSLALVQRGQARDRARAAELTRLATQAATLDGDQLSLGLLLGVEARRLDPSDTTDSALGAALDNAPDGLERLIPVPGGVGYGSASPNRRRIATAGRDGKARIVAVPSGRIVSTMNADADLGVARFSPDGHLVVVSTVFGERGAIRVFDAGTGRPAGPKLLAGPGIVLGQFLPNDSSQLVTASSGELIRWDVSDPSRPRPIGAPIPLEPTPETQGSVTVVEISPDGRTAATSALSVGDLGPPGSSFVWDLESGAQRLGPLTGRLGAFTPDGTELMLRRPDRIAFVDAVTGADRSSLPLGFAPGIGLRMSDDGRHLAVSDDATGDLHVFDVATGQPIGQLTSFAGSSYPMAFLPRNRLLVASQDQAAVWRYLDDAPAFAKLLPGVTGGANVQFTPDGSEIVTIGDVDRQVQHFRARDGKPLGRVFDAGAATSSSLAISPDGSTVAIPGVAGTVNIWDRRTGTVLSALPTGQTEPVGVAWSPSKPVLATVSGSDPAVVLWDVSDPRRPTEQHRLGNGDVVGFPWRNSTFSPDGRVVAVNDYPTLGWVTLVDVARGRVLGQERKGGQVGIPLVYSPDGETIATARYSEGSLLLLDAATGRTRVERNIADWPSGWRFVHGGRHIAVGSRPGSESSLGPTVLELWDATTLEPTGTRMTIARSGWFAGANPDGTKLVITTPEGAVLLDLDPEHWERLACRIAGRNLTRAEWNQYLPGHDYHRTCPTEDLRG
jgi:DNA-binding SARP family transcriptional activator/WD40 repeat protein